MLVAMWKEKLVSQQESENPVFNEIFARLLVYARYTLTRTKIRKFACRHGKSRVTFLQNQFIKSGRDATTGSNTD